MYTLYMYIALHRLYIMTGNVLKKTLESDPNVKTQDTQDTLFSLVDTDNYQMTVEV